MGCREGGRNFTGTMVYMLLWVTCVREWKYMGRIVLVFKTG